MLPANVDPVPSVAELSTCQKTLHAWAPFVRTTLLPDPVVSASRLDDEDGIVAALAIEGHGSWSAQQQCAAVSPDTREEDLVGEIGTLQDPVARLAGGVDS